MLNKAQSHLLLDASPLNGLLAQQLHSATSNSFQFPLPSALCDDPGYMQQMQLLLQAKIAENQQLNARVSELEAIVQHSRTAEQSQQNAIKKLQAQIVVLEERYRLTAAQQDSNGELLASNASTAVSPGSSCRVPSLLAGSKASAFAAVAASSAMLPLETSSSGGSNSSTAGAAGTGGTASSMLSTSGDSAMSPGGAVASSNDGVWPGPAESTGSLGLKPAPSAPSHLAVDAAIAAGGLLQQAVDTPLSQSPLPPTLSGLSRSLSLSAAAAVSKQHKQRQVGGSAGGALAPDNSSSEDFSQDAEVWPAPLVSRSQSLLSTRDFAAAAPAAAGAADTWRFAGSASAASGGLAAALSNAAHSSSAPVSASAAASSSGGFPVPTAPQPILGPHSHSRQGVHHGAAPSAAATTAAAGAAASPWSAAAANLSSSVGGAAGLGAGLNSSSNFAFSPASWEHPLLMAGRQGSALLDALQSQQAATSGDSAAAAAAAAEYQGLIAAAAAQLDAAAVAAAAASANTAGLQAVQSDRFSHDSNLAGLLPYDLNRLVTEGSFGSLSGSVAGQSSGVLGASHGSLDDLQQVLVAQQLVAAAAAHQGQQQSAAAAAAAAAAAVAVMQQQGQAGYGAPQATAAAGNATVRGGKPLQLTHGSFTGAAAAAAAQLKCGSSGGGRIPIPTPGSKAGALSASRSQQALLRAASGPPSSAFLDGGDDTAAMFGTLNTSDLAFGSRGQSEVMFTRGGSSSLREAGLLSMAVEAEAREREKKAAAAAVVKKWTDSWGPESSAEAVSSPTARDTFSSSMSRSAPGGSSALAAAMELPDTADQDQPDQDSAIIRHGGSSMAASGSFGGAGSLAASISGGGSCSAQSLLISAMPGGGSSLGLTSRPSGCNLTRSASALAASEISGACDGEGGPGQELDAAAQNTRLRSKQDASPNTCVYVGFLGWWVSERDLIEYFSPYGELVSVRLLISKKSRRSREQAFVEYAEVEQAQRAITWLDTIDNPSLVKQLGCGGLVVRFADRKKPAFEL